MAEIKVPELAESITEGTIAQWLKKTGDQINKGDFLVELETDKVNVEIVSEFTGTLSELKFAEGDTVKVGETIAFVNEQGKDSPSASDDREQPKQTAKPAPHPETLDDSEPHHEAPLNEVAIKESASEAHKSRTIASPAARKLAREKGIDISDVPTVDPLGRVRKQDISSYQISNQKEETNSKPFSLSGDVPAQVNHEEKRVVHERMSRRRQTIAKRLVEVQQTAAMLTTFNEVDMTEILKLRKKRGAKFFEEHDVKLGFMSFFTKAAVIALKKFPYLNAEIAGDEFLVKKYYDIGIAVSAPEGLVVPVVRDADRKSFGEIEKDIMQLAEKARANKLALKDLQGGTFTITNGGVFGSLLSTPILNGPQVGILGMHKTQLRPVAIDEERMENRPMMYIALSYDHRIVDGKEAVSFLVKIKELLEDPETFLLEG